MAMLVEKVLVGVRKLYVSELLAHSTPPSSALMRVSELNGDKTLSVPVDGVATFLPRGRNSRGRD